MKSLRNLFIFSVAVYLVFTQASNVYAGFGVSPGIIEEEKLVPGATLERTIYLVQGNQDQDIAIKATVESKDIADWFTFTEGSEFTIPANQQQFPLHVQIKVPEDAKLGVYSAFIRVTTLPKKIEDTQVTIALGGKVNVNLKVGNDPVLEFNVRSLEIFDIKEGGRPKVAVSINNTGNVPAAPENASFELFNKYGEIRLAYAENDEFTKVKAFSEGTSIIEFPMDVRLGVGEYWGHVKIYNDGKIIKELRTVFNVSQKSFIEKNLYSLIALAAIIVIVAGFFIWKRRKNRQSIPPLTFNQ